MFFFLRKLIEAILLPLGMSGILVIAGIFLRRRWLSLVGILLLYAFSTPAVADRMLLSLERTWEARPIEAAPTADAIVVLSGGVVRGQTAPGVQWGDSASRYFAGFDLAMAGKAKIIVFSGAPTEDRSAPTQGAILRDVASRNGLQPERIVVTPHVSTTEDEARAVSRIPGIHSILLVTSAFHMPRAVLLFRARGFDVSPFPTDNRVFGVLHLGPSAFIPSAAPLHDSELALREYYGLAVYSTILRFHKPA